MITDLFSKRQRRARGDVPDVYQHEIFPQKLRAQVVLLWRDAFQLKSHYPDPHRCMEQTVDILRKEYGKFALCGEGYLTPALELSQFFMQGWAYSPKATAATLIDVLLDNELLPTFTQSQLTSVRQLLSSGIPTVRNRLGGHGQGSSITDVPEHLATYVLNLTATTVRLLSDADQALQGN